MSQLFVWVALGCALAAAVVGFGWVNSDDYFGWIALVLAAHFAARAAA